MQKEDSLTKPEYAFPKMGWGEANCGMTLRDYFAAAALTGLLATDPNMEQDKPQDAIAGICFFMADAMLKERSRAEEE